MSDDLRQQVHAWLFYQERLAWKNSLVKTSKENSKDAKADASISQPTEPNADLIARLNEEQKNKDSHSKKLEDSLNKHEGGRSGDIDQLIARGKELDKKIKELQKEQGKPVSNVKIPNHKLSSQFENSTGTDQEELLLLNKAQEHLKSNIQMTFSLERQIIEGGDTKGVKETLDAIKEFDTYLLARFPNLGRLIKPLPLSDITKSENTKSEEKEAQVEEVEASRKHELEKEKLNKPKPSAKTAAKVDSDLDIDRGSDLDIDLGRRDSGEGTGTVGVTQAAGILFIAENGKVLLGQRSEYGAHPLTWAIFGGHQERGETLELTARREVFEETGYSSEEPVQLIAQTETDGTTFSVFMCICNQFDVVTNREHVDCGWFAMGEEPNPKPPGLDEVLNLPVVVGARKKRMNETDVAKAMAKGALSSPQRFVNMSLYRIRITGTGTAFRKGYKDKKGKKYKDEHVFRCPDNYLTPGFLERCNGLPVIFEHPKGKLLDSEEFNDRVVGTIVVPYIQGDEVWGVARIYDDAVITLLDNEKLSTSPAVYFTDTSENSTISLDDGSQLLIEGNPGLLDHIAICEVGVWDKDGPPQGIDSNLVD